MGKTKSLNFAGRLKELRENAGLTQQQVGDRAGIHKLSVAKLEQGIREPTWETVVAICEALGVSCEEFRKPPAEREPAGPGRPRKDASQEQAEEIPAVEKKPAAKGKSKRKGKGKG